MLMNAVICVWNEEDIIESTVKHALAQGCSNVFIVDNNSTDKTVNTAINAGAILADSFGSEYFNEYQKIAYLNTVVKKYNESCKEDYIWWLYIDADEFPNIDCELRIIDFIKLLDPSIKAVHGYMFNHIPTHAPYNISGYHPADFMQLANKTNTTKIPLIRYDKGKPHFYSASGAHHFDTCGENVPIVLDVLNIHHFNYRRQENTFRRLKQLTTKNSNGVCRVDLFDKLEQMHKKSKNAKSTYHNRYDSAKSIYNENKYKILMMDELHYSYDNLVRWYHPHSLKITDDCSKHDALLNIAIHYYFLGDIDLALCRFNDLIEIADNNKVQMLVIIKIALCLASTNKIEALNLLQPLLKCNDADVRNYAEKQSRIIYEDKIFTKNISKRNGELLFDTANYSLNFKCKIFI